MFRQRAAASSRSSVRKPWSDVVSWYQMPDAYLVVLEQRRHVDAVELLHRLPTAETGIFKLLLQARMVRKLPDNSAYFKFGNSPVHIEPQSAQEHFAKPFVGSCIQRSVDRHKAHPKHENIIQRPATYQT